MKSENFSFDNGRGYSLSARFDAPEGERRACALFAHCFTCDKNLNAVRRIANELVRRGIAVFSFDFTGLGSSEGEFSEGHFSSQANDIISAAEYLQKTYGITPDFLVGHSLGGTACLYAARSLKGVRGVATIGSPFDPEHATHLFDSDVTHIIESGESAEVCISGRPFRVNAQFVKDFKSHPPSQWIGDVHQEVLLLHSPVDSIVEIAHAEKLFMALRHPKSYISLGNADHMLSKKKDAQIAASVISGWAEKFFHAVDGESAAAAGDDTPTISKSSATAVAAGAATIAPPHSDHQVVAEIGAEPFVTQVGVANRYGLVADEPPSVGGTDTGPTPFGYLLTSLATCTVMTLQVYSKRKNYELTRAVTHCDYHAKPKPCIERWIEVEGNLTAEQRERMLDIANLCPVHKLLEAGIEIKTAFLNESAAS